jgi:DNA-binding MarR family transcriptional regulator
MLARGLLSRSRTETDARANALSIAPAGRRALRSARLASERAERRLLEPLPPSERTRFVKSLALIAAAADQFVEAGVVHNHKKPATRAASTARRF